MKYLTLNEDKEPRSIHLQLLAEEPDNEPDEDKDPEDTPEEQPPKDDPETDENSTQDVPARGEGKDLSEEYVKELQKKVQSLELQQEKPNIAKKFGIPVSLLEVPQAGDTVEEVTAFAEQISDKWKDERGQVADATTESMMSKYGRMIQPEAQVSPEDMPDLDTQIKKARDEGNVQLAAELVVQRSIANGSVKKSG